MGQPKKQSDIRGQNNQNVKGTTNVQKVRPNDQNLTPAKRPQAPESEHPNQKLSNEKPSH